jgi:hypothetical protein
MNLEALRAIAANLDSPHQISFTCTPEWFAGLVERLGTTPGAKEEEAEMNRSCLLVQALMVCALKAGSAGAPFRYGRDPCQLSGSGKRP